MRTIFHVLKTNVLLFLLLLSVQGFAQIEEGYYTIHQAAASGVEGFWDKEGDNASLKGLNSTSASQVFKIEKEGSIYYIKQAGDGRAIDASYWHRNENGCPVIFWEFNKGETQRWVIQRSSGDNYFIKLALNNKIITGNVPGSVGSPDLYLTNVVDLAKQIFTIKKSTRIIKSLNFVDLRANQTPYANQGPRGTCTYFASIAALEAGYKKAGYGDINLSEQFYSIFAKNFCLHPVWAENRSANFRENQYALTQGGGTVEALKSISMVKESISPYETTEDLGPYLWSDLSQRNCSSFNLDLIKTKLPSLADVSQYYGVQSFSRITSINEANLENVLRAGYEIKICIYRGSHCVLLVGFDKTDPLNKKLIIKNSYQPTGTACTEKLEYLSYSEIPAMVSAEYVTAVKAPHTWREMAAIGRWKLNFDGWKGTLDIYHIPGVSQFDLNKYGAVNGSIITDRRLGTFYDVSGNAFRVNGSITPYNASSVKIIFYIDGATPNLRWDALSGRRFEYIISLPEPDYMAGIHRDGDGSEYGGYAIKNPENYFSSNSFSPTGNITAFRNLSFLVRYKNSEYFGSFNTYNATLGTLRGTFTNASGVTKTFQLKNLDYTRSYTFSVDGDAVSGKVITHSWDPGVASGFVKGSALSNSHPVSIIRRINNPFLAFVALPGTIFSGLRQGESDEIQNSEIEISESNDMITIDDMLDRNKQVSIYNMAGGNVFTMEYGEAGRKTFTTELPDGMYIVVVHSDNLIKTKKILLQKQ